MKTAWLGLGTLTLALGCGGSGGPDKPANTAGTSSGGAGNGTAGSNAGNTNGGSLGQSGSATGGANNAAGNTSGGGSAGMAGSASGGSGGSSGSGAMGFVCPAGPFDKPTFGTPMRVEGVPPADTFNNNNNDFTNIEGAVWVGDALYVSEIASKGGGNFPSRILKIAADGKVSIAVPDSGTNGLAINGAGELFGAKHSDGTVSKIAMPAGTATPVASMFMAAGDPIGRFNSPNDLTIHKNGTIYFTDPNWQAPTTKPQKQTRAYVVPPGGMPQAIADTLSEPNGITLSKDQNFLFIGGGQLKKYPVDADGKVGAGTDFVSGGGSDGMVIDCADNLYTTKNKLVTVYSSAGTMAGMLTVAELGEVTNVAFGGADRKTLYVTGQGAGNQKGLFKVPMNLPGFPY